MLQQLKQPNLNGFEVLTHGEWAETLVMAPGTRPRKKSTRFLRAFSKPRRLRYDVSRVESFRLADDAFRAFEHHSLNTSCERVTFVSVDYATGVRTTLDELTFH